MTLGVLRCLVARVGDERYAVPVTNVVETITLRDALTQTVAGVPMLVRDGVPIPLADLGAALDVAGDRDPRVAVVVRYGGGTDQLAWTVDALVGEQEIVVKDLGGVPRPAAGRQRRHDRRRRHVLLLLDVRELALEQLASGQPFTDAHRRGRARSRVDGVPAASVNRKPPRARRRGQRSASASSSG